MATFGGVEAGGTTFVVTLAKGTPTNITKRHEIKTTTPKDTIAKVLTFLKKHHVDSIGLAAFGPIDIDEKSPTYGYVTSTPKALWRNYDILGQFQRMGVPVAFNTDVQAAALGELHHGDHGDISSCCYVTIGTGVGVGVVSHNRPVSGLTHPEGGHIRVPRHPDDTYAGNCPYHGDCIEGLCNAKALADRAGVDPSELRHLPDSHPVFELQAHYLALLCSSLTLIASPEVIVLGGGVMRRRSLFPRIRKNLQKLLNGYVPLDKITKHMDTYVVPSVHNVGKHDNAGSVGALRLAQSALQSAKPRSRL